MIRITGGVAKGRILKVPTGNAVRPTSDKVRQALFNILSHRFNLDFENVRVLDLFAGSGALGLEAMSRGASYIQFVELEPQHVKLMKENIKAVQDRFVGQERRERTVIHTQNVNRFLLSPPELPFHLIFMDPPYALCEELQYLKALEESWLTEGGYVIIEHTKHNLFELPKGWSELLRRRYGDTYLTICTRSTSC